MKADSSDNKHSHLGCSQNKQKPSQALNFTQRRFTTAPTYTVRAFTSALGIYSSNQSPNKFATAFLSTSQKQQKNTTGDHLFYSTLLASHISSSNFPDIQPRSSRPTISNLFPHPRYTSTSVLGIDRKQRCTNMPSSSSAETRIITSTGGIPAIMSEAELPAKSGTAMTKALDT